MFGWRPQEEWTGPAERWRTAEEFLEEGKRINGFLRKDMATLRAEIGRRDQAIAEMRQLVAAEFLVAARGFGPLVSYR